MDDKVDKRLAVAVERRDAMQALVSSPGWEHIVAWVRMEVEQHKNVILRPIETQIGLYGQEFLKGAVTAMEAIVDRPEALIAIAEDEIATLRPAKE